MVAGGFAFRRGKGAKRRVVHYTEFDRHGRPTGSTLCGRTDINTTCNLPLGLKRCKNCIREYNRPND